MAHSANRPIDFAPAWLKLPEQSQERRQDFNQNSHHHIARNSVNNNVNNQHQTHAANHHSSIHNYSSHPHHHASARQGRPPLNSFNGRSVSHPHPNQLQRSQSTGSYTDNGNGHNKVQSVGLQNTSVVSSKPLEEDFPLLSSGPLSSPSHNHINNTTAQWRIKLSAAEHQRGREESHIKPGQNNDKFSLTSNMPGKVYRAQVKPVRRSQMIPITNGRNSSIKTSENGDHGGMPMLSSSVEKEKRLLQQMGWKEDDYSDDECGIPEQDPEKLQEIFMKAKAAREQLLMKSRHSLKPAPTVTAILPNEDDLPSSSDNSDVE